MKAPDKIYIRPQTNPNMLGGLWSGKQTKEATVPYIRKDAILEWAEKKKNEVKKFGQRYNEANYYNSGCHDTIQELIDKINKL